MERVEATSFWIRLSFQFFNWIKSNQTDSILLCWFKKKSFGSINFSSKQMNSFRKADFLLIQIALLTGLHFLCTFEFYGITSNELKPMDQFWRLCNTFASMRDFHGLTQILLTKEKQKKQTFSRIQQRFQQSRSAINPKNIFSFVFIILLRTTFSHEYKSLAQTHTYQIK